MYCVPDSLARALGRSQAEVRRELAHYIGHDPALCYGLEHVNAIPRITGRRVEFEMLEAPLTLRAIILREFKKGPYLVSFKVGHHKRHVVYVDGGVIHCNSLGSVWFADYRWERARVTYVMRP